MGGAQPGRDGAAGMTAMVTNTEPALRRFWHPVALADDAGDQPLHVQLLGTHYVVVEIDGQLSAFEDSCPHRSYPLSRGYIVDGTLRCGYHGYRFDVDGRCVVIPAMPAETPIPKRADLIPVARVCSHLGWIWIAPEEPVEDLPSIPEVDDERFGRILLGPYTWKCGAAQMTDNFLDVSHFPFVHIGTFGIEEDALIPPFRVERDGLRFSFEYAHEFRNGEDASAMQAVTSDSQQRTIVSSYLPPFGTVIRVNYAQSGVRTTVVSYSSPLDDATSRLFTIFLSTDFDQSTAEQAKRFEEEILLEDQVALEGYRVPAMVLDPDAEFHTRADRMTVELRRVLAEIINGQAATEQQEPSE